MESGYAYPERSADNPAETCENVEAETDVRIKNNITAPAEVSRGHSKPATSRTPEKGQMRKPHKGRRTEC